MSATNFDKALTLVLAHEGGFVDHPKDPGGPTNKGVTQAVYDAYRKNKGLALRSVKQITKAELRDIYDRQYWDAAKCDQMPAGIDYALFDFCVNSGVSRAVKELQRTAKIGVDGIVGQKTIAAVCDAINADEEAFITEYCRRRMTFLRSLRNWRTFGKGWTRRVMGDMDGAQITGDRGVIDFAVAMAKNDLAYPIPKKVLPAAIGTKEGEVAAKAPESKQAFLKTIQGLGTGLTGSGVSGSTLYSYAQQIQPHIGETLIGRVALIGFVVLMTVGIALIGLDWLRKQKEKPAA